MRDVSTRELSGPSRSAADGPVVLQLGVWVLPMAP